MADHGSFGPDRRSVSPAASNARAIARRPGSASFAGEREVDGPKR